MDLGEKTRNCYFYTLVIEQIKQTRCKVFIMSFSGGAWQILVTLNRARLALTPFFPVFVLHQPSANRYEIGINLPS